MALHPESTPTGPRHRFPNAFDLLSHGHQAGQERLQNWNQILLSRVTRS